MMHVPYTTFLQALGCAIINSLWQFAFIWLIYFLVNTFFKISSKHKYLVALLLQFTGFIWFAGTLFFYYQHWNSISDKYEYINAFSFRQVNLANSSVNSIGLSLLANAKLFLPYLSIAYLLLLLFLSIKWMQSYFYTRRIKQNGLSKIAVDWRLFVQKISGQLGIKQRVSIYSSNRVKAPLTIGFLKPVILIPLASINQLSVEQMEAVILHELAHIKRFDYLVNLLLTLIEVVMFFNPFMQLLSKHLKRERENSCDDWVLQYEYNAATYARALLKIALLQAPSQPSFGMSAAANKNVLLTRVKRMIEKNEKSFHYKHQLFALLLTTIILSFIAWFSPGNRNDLIVNPDQLSKFKKLPLAIIVDNPLFNPVFFWADTQNGEDHNQQKLIAKVKPQLSERSLSLAIPAKSHLVTLNEISSSVIINPASVKNKMEMFATMNLSIDTTFHKEIVTKFYPSASLIQIDKTEKEARKILTEMEKNIKIKQSYNKDIIVQSMKIALAQIKEAKLKLIKQKPVLVIGKLLTGNQNYDEAYSTNLPVFKNEEELQAFSEELKKQFEEMKQLYVLTKINEDMNVGYTVPAVVHSIPASHGLSFEYNDKVKESSSTATSVKEKNNTQTELIKISSLGDSLNNNSEVDVFITIHPKKEPLKKITKKTLQTIRI